MSELTGEWLDGQIEYSTGDDAADARVERALQLCVTIDQWNDQIIAADTSAGAASIAAASSWADRCAAALIGLAPHDEHVEVHRLIGKMAETLTAAQGVLIQGAAIAWPLFLSDRSGASRECVGRIIRAFVAIHKALPDEPEDDTQRQARSALVRDAGAAWGRFGANRSSANRETLHRVLEELVTADGALDAD